MATLSPDERAQVAAVPIVQRLAPDARDAVLDAAESIAFLKGAAIVTQGEVGDAFFLLLEGSLEVYLDGDDGEIHLATLEPGAHFGEQALLRSGGRLRTANVRAVSAGRCVAVSRETFIERVADEPTNRESFDQASASNLHNDLLRSLDAFRGLELNAATVDGVSRQVYAPGEAIVTEGAASDAVYFVVDGVAIVIAGRDGLQETLRRVGSGQCFGELGVMNRAPRSATVRAETSVQVLRIDADVFRGWVAEHPQLRDFLGTLETVYPLRDGRAMSVYRGMLLGRPAISTVHGDPSGDCLVSTKIIGEDVVVLAHGGAIEGEEGAVAYVDPKTGRETTLHLADVVRDSNGTIIAGRLMGLMAMTDAVRAGGLYRKVLHREAVDAVALERFRVSGFLGGSASEVDPDTVCRCLGLSKQAVLDAAEAHGASVEAVRTAIGAGVICGECRGDVSALLGVTPPSPSEPAPTGVLRRGLAKLGWGRKR